MIGPGKYNDACTQAREATRAKGVCLIVFDGERGSGFSAQLPYELLECVPQVLREMADEIEQKGATA